MLCHSIGEANLYFNMYLNFKNNEYLLRAFAVHYNHTMLLCMEWNMYFKARSILDEPYEERKRPVFRIV
jgi:hypothetical protein